MGSARKRAASAPTVAETLERFETAIYESTLPPHARLCALAMLHHATPGPEECFHSDATRTAIARWTGLSVATVKRELASLAAQGWTTGKSVVTLRIPGELQRWTRAQRTTLASCEWQPCPGCGRTVPVIKADGCPAAGFDIFHEPGCAGETQRAAAGGRRRCLMDLYTELVLTLRGDAAAAVNELLRVGGEGDPVVKPEHVVVVPREDGRWFVRNSVGGPWLTGPAVDGASTVEALCAVIERAHEEAEATGRVAPFHLMHRLKHETVPVQRLGKAGAS